MILPSECLCIVNDGWAGDGEEGLDEMATECRRKRWSGSCTNAFDCRSRSCSSTLICLHIVLVSFREQVGSRQRVSKPSVTRARRIGE